MVRSSILASLALIFSGGSAYSKEQAQPIVGPKNGSLVIMGGGGKDRTFPQIFAHFIKLAGGKNARIVIVPTAASSSPDHNYQRSWSLDLAKSMGVKRATILHSHSRKTADTEAFAEPLKTATGVWFGGGAPVEVHQSLWRDPD